MVKIIGPNDRDCGTAQTPGMEREAGISAKLTGAEGLWMGIARNEAGGVSGVHHHGATESGIYVVKGHMRFRWGDNLENVADAEAGDFIFVPPWEVHMEENLDKDAPTEFLLARNSQEAVVVNVPDPRIPK